MSSEFKRIVTAAVGLPITASDDDIAMALGELLGNKAANTKRQDGAKSFNEMVSAKIASEGISYSEAASIISRDHPDLYFAHRDQASLN